MAKQTRVKLKPSEYGGSDTQDSRGVQPFPHTMEPHEQMRMIYSTDPADPTSEPPDPTAA